MASIGVPEREMQPQARPAWQGVLRRLLSRCYIESAQVEDRRSGTVTEPAGQLTNRDRLDTIDPRQLTLLED